MLTSCTGKDPRPDFNDLKCSLPVLSQLIHSQDKEVITDASWALSYLSDGEDINIQGVIDSGVVPRLAELLSHPDNSIVTPAIAVLGKYRHRK